MLKVEGNIRKSFKTYRRTKGNNLKLNEYITLANGFMEHIMEDVGKGNELTLPSNMGTLCVVGRKVPIQAITENGMRLLPPDWVATKKLRDSDPVSKAERKVVYHLNEETNGTIYKVHWSKKNMILTNKTLYSLKIARDPARAISDLIKGGKEYFRKIQQHGKSD